MLLTPILIRAGHCPKIFKTTACCLVFCPKTWNNILPFLIFVPNLVRKYIVFIFVPKKFHPVEGNIFVKDIILLTKIL